MVLVIGWRVSGVFDAIACLCERSGDWWLFNNGLMVCGVQVEIVSCDRSSEVVGPGGDL